MRYSDPLTWIVFLWLGLPLLGLWLRWWKLLSELAFSSKKDAT